MANIIIPQIVIVDPSGSFPSAFAPGESLIMQRAPGSALVQVTYNYSGGAQPIPEKVNNAPSGSQFETRAIQLLTSVRGVVWV